MPTAEYLVLHPFADLEADDASANIGLIVSYRPAIVGLTGTLPSLEAVVTSTLDLGSRIDLYLDDVLQAWFLVTGAADATDPTGEVAPLDYDPDTNDKHWKKGL